MWGVLWQYRKDRGLTIDLLVTAGHCLSVTHVYIMLLLMYILYVVCVVTVQEEAWADNRPAGHCR